MLVVLVTVPGVLLVTVVTMVQPPFGMLVPLATVITPAATVTPVQVPVLVSGLLVTPAGSVSVKAAVNACAAPVLLASVMVNVLVPPTPMVAGVKLLVGAGTVATVRFAVAAAALLPLLVCNAPAAIVLVTVPTVLLVTLAVIVQEPGAPAGIVAPDA